jgi:hypothetical protein
MAFPLFPAEEHQEEIQRRTYLQHAPARCVPGTKGFRLIVGHGFRILNEIFYGKNENIYSAMKNRGRARACGVG